MSVIGSNIIAGASGTVETGYQISRSLRFNSADSAYLTRTPSVAGNSQKFTISGWVKRSRLSSGEQCIFNARAGAGTPRFRIFFTANDTLQQDSDNFGQLTTTQVFRDSSAWCHILFAADSTQATDTNRKKLYVNGVQVTAFSTSTYPTQNTSSSVNSTIAHDIGVEQVNSIYFNGYLADVRLIDGQALDPTSFGETDSATGVWVPKAYTGTYGTNGFWLKFDDNSGTTATTLGKDSSGNGNNWTPNNFSVTAGVGNDSLVDSPTNYGTDTGAGGEVRGNYCTLNPLASTGTMVNGNLDGTTAINKTNFGSIAFPNTGKWYFETVMTNAGALNVGLAAYVTNAANVYNISSSVLYSSSGKKNVDNVLDQNYGASFASGDVIGIAADADAGTVTFYKNNVSQGAISHVVGGLFPAFGNGGVSTDFTVNFGQRPFAYTAPSGFKALCTQNLPTPAIGASASTLASKNFNTILYNGNNNVSQTISGVGFQPDLIWIKNRDNVEQHHLMDAVRGNNKFIRSNSTDAERTGSYLNGYNALAFTSDGFSITNATSQSDELNFGTRTYVTWAWKANGAGVSNTAGSITSTVSANTTAGISVVTYTGNGSTTGATVGHGLGVAPRLIIVKNRGRADDWLVQHASSGATGYLNLNGTGAFVSSARPWNNTAPTSSVFTVNTFAAENWTNRSADTYVAYCFAEVAGFSKFGSYTGNGSADGPFVYCGFRPAFVLIKNASVGGAGYNWELHDAARGPYNAVGPVLLPNLSDAEVNTNRVDFLSNGFKLRGTGASVNGSGNTIIFAAFAEAPFNYARAR